MTQFVDASAQLKDTVAKGNRDHLAATYAMEAVTGQHLFIRANRSCFLVDCNMPPYSFS